MPWWYLQQRLGHGNTHAKERFKQNLDLLHLKEAWTDAKILNTPEVSQSSVLFSLLLFCLQIKAWITAMQILGSYLTGVDFHALMMGINVIQVWDILTKKAMEQMKIEIAIKACQDSCNATLLMELTQLQQVEEHFLLAGHILLLLQFYDAAQVCMYVHMYICIISCTCCLLSML